LRTNLRYGCTILRHYLDIERGDLYRALGRYNGSLGQPAYPNMVRMAWQNQWSYAKRAQQAGSALTLLSRGCPGIIASPVTSP
jgi:soluble lytic murein transglycosylase-like protein